MKLRTFFGGWLAVACGLNLWLSWAVPRPLAMAWVTDRGWVQLSGLFALLVAAWFAVLIGRRLPALRWQTIRIAYLILLYAAREGDIPQLLFSGSKPTKLSFYLEPDIPVIARCAAFFLGVVWLIASWQLARNMLQRFSLAQLRRQYWVRYTVLWLAFALSMHLQERTAWNHWESGKIFEEVQDMLAQLAVLLGLFDFLRNHSRTQAPP